MVSALFVLVAAYPQPSAFAASSSPVSSPVATPGDLATAESLNAVAQAISKTIASTSAVSYRLEGAQVFGPAPTPVLGHGAFDLQHGVGRAVLHQPSGTQLVVLTPTIVFTHVPAGGGAALPKGKSWLSADLTGSESLNTNFPQFVVQVEGFNPLLFLEETAWGAVTAKPISASVVNGTRAQGYLVTVNLTRALTHASGASATSMSLAIRSELGSLGAGGGLTGEVVTVRLWLQPAGRVVMIRASPPGAGVGTTTINLSQFGLSVRSVPPPLSKVVDLAALTPSGERENNGGGDSDGA